MPDRSIAALRSLLDELRPVFTAPTFNNFVLLVCGWILIPGHHAVTAALVITGMSQQRDHSAYHRFFSLARWRPDEIGRRLFMRILNLGPVEGPVRISVDDTLSNKQGQHIFGIGSHPDPVRSTKKRKVFAFGHVWVVLTVSVRIAPFQRVWGLPVLLRLYRNKQSCAKKKREYRKKTELAHEMLEIFASWVPNRRIELSADSAYCNSTVTKGMAKNIVLIGSMRPDAALTALPILADESKKKGGRRPIRGQRLPTPEQVYKEATYGWHVVDAVLYNRLEHVMCQRWTAQWYRACGGQLLHIVVTQTAGGDIPFRVFFCTDPNVSVAYMLERYASRWSIEVTFFDMKQFLGFADSQAWSRLAVERTAPFVAYLYTIIVIWYAASVPGTPLDFFPVRPWYRHKKAPSFADMLGAAQRAALQSGVFDPGRNSNNLHNPLTPAQFRPDAAQAGGA
jgi:SRSO17 transposase